MANPPTVLGQPVDMPFQAMKDLTYTHRGTSCRECFDAAMHIAKKNAGTVVVSSLGNTTVLQNTTEISPHISTALSLPSSLTYSDRWVYESRCGEDRFLVNTTVEFGTYVLRIGSQYRTTRGSSGAPDTAVRTKVQVRGLDKNPVMFALFQMHVGTEFTTQRTRERRRIDRVRRAVGASGQQAAPEVLLTAVPQVVYAQTANAQTANAQTANAQVSGAHEMAGASETDAQVQAVTCGSR